MHMPMLQTESIETEGLVLRGRYLVLGVPLEIACASAQAFARADETYAAFRQSQAAQPAFGALVERSGAAAYRVADTRGYAREWADEQAATIDLLDRIVHGVLAELYQRGIYAIHAGAVVGPQGALLIAGRSGQGKTTLVLGMLRNGFGLLSDEFAVAEPASQRLLPYRRSIHIRPGTPELIPELAFVADRPQVRLGGGIEWTLTPDDLARAFPGCLAEAAPLRGVLLLDGAPRPGAEPAITPLPAALATIELLRGTWAVSQDFGGGLARLGALLSGVPCARLRAGKLSSTVAQIAGWLEAPNA